MRVKLQMPHAIGPGQVAGRHARFLKGARGPQSVGPRVDIDVALDAQERAVPLGTNHQIVCMVPSMRRGEQMLASILDPSHGMPDLHRDRGDCNVLRHDPVLPAEAASDIGRYDTHLVFRNPQHAGERQPLHLATLGGEIDDQLIQAMVPVGEHASPFQRDCGLSVEP